MGRREQEDDSVKLITWVQSLIHVITLLTSGMHLWSWHSYCEMRRESRDFPDTHRPASLEFAEWYSQDTQLQIKVEGLTVQRIWGKGMLIPKVRPYHTPSPKSQGTSQKREQKGCKDQRLGTNAMKSYLNMIWLLHSWFTKAVANYPSMTWTRSSQSTFIQQWGRDSWGPTLGEKLLAAHGC